MPLFLESCSICWGGSSRWLIRLPDWCFLRRGTTTSLRSSVSCTGSRLRSELISSLLSLYTSAYMEQHPRTLLMNSARRRISAHDVAFVQRHLHNWSSAVRICKPSSTELFLSPPHTCGTVCRSTWHPLSLSLFFADVWRLISSSAAFLDCLCRAWAVTFVIFRPTNHSCYLLINFLLVFYSQLCLYLISFLRYNEILVENHLF